MNKAKLIEVITEKTNRQAKRDEDYINKKVAERMIDVMTETITEELKHDREVTITGFGTFEAMVRYARGGVNPRNPQERITIPAVRVAKFRTGKNLKDALKTK